MKSPLSPKRFRERLTEEMTQAIDSLCDIYEAGYDIRYGSGARGEGRFAGHSDQTGELATGRINEEGRLTRRGRIEAALIHASIQIGPTIGSLDGLGDRIYKALGNPAAQQQEAYERKRPRRRRKGGYRALAERIVREETG